MALVARQSILVLCQAFLSLERSRVRNASRSPNNVYIGVLAKVTNEKKKRDDQPVSGVFTVSLKCCQEMIFGLTFCVCVFIGWPT